MIVITDQEQKVLLTRPDLEGGSYRVLEEGDLYIVYYSSNGSDWFVILEYPIKKNDKDVFLGIWIHPGITVSRPIEFVV